MTFPKEFFRKVFRGTLQSDDFDVEVRCLYQTGEIDFRSPRQFWFRTLLEFERRWPEVAQLNADGYDIHFTVLPRLSGPRKNKEHPLPSIPTVSVLWADIDVGRGKPFRTIKRALRRVRKLKFPPNIIVKSGTGLHLYYMLKKPRKIPRDRLERSLRSLAILLKADVAAARASRLMRVPGTFNWKRGGNGKLVMVRYPSGLLHRFKTLEAAWKAREDDSADQSVKIKPPNAQPSNTPDYFDLFEPHVKKLVRSGEWARGLCPFHDDRNPSFSINARSGRWVCFACGVEGNWTDFKRRCEITDSNVRVGQRDSTEEYEWRKLPHFNPSKAPKTKWLVEGLIPERGITMLVGAPGAFKSTFSILLASAVSKGEDFLDHPTLRRRVLYLDNENPPDVLKSRNDNMKLAIETNDSLRLWTMYDERPVPKLLDKRLRLIIKRSVEDGRKVLLVLDHWSSFLRAGDGGETTGQTSQLLQELKHLCAIGATILILHHTRKYHQDIEYGGNDLRAKCDAIHTLLLHRDAVNPNKKVIQMDCFLKRHGGNSSFSFRPRVVNREVVGFEPTRDPRTKERAQKRWIIEKLVSQNSQISQRAIVTKAQEQGLSRDEAREILTSGISKYWKVKVGAHGAKKYILLKR
jgi:hypothetical protein